MSDAKAASEQPDIEINYEKPATKESGENLDSLRKKAAERDQYLDMAQRTRAEF